MWEKTKPSLANLNCHKVTMNCSHFTLFYHDESLLAAFLQKGDGHQSICTFSYGSHYNHAMVPTIRNFYSISMVINHSVVGVYLLTLVGDI